MAGYIVWCFAIALLAIPIVIGSKCRQTRTTNSTVLDCRSLRLKIIPRDLPIRLTSLDLSKNSIRHITKADLKGYSAIRSFNCSHNGVRRIDIGAFDELKDLETLDLTLNHIHLDPDHFPLEMLQYNTKLRMLLLAGQYVSSKGYPIRTIRQLTHLERLSLTPLNENIPSDLAKMSSLKVLDFQWGNISKLTGRSMQPFANSNIEELSFHQCGMHEMEDGVFSGFNNLKLLNLACNYNLVPSRVIDVLSVSVNHSIDSLVVDGTNGILKDFSGWRLGKKDITECRSMWTQLKRFSFRAINLDDIYINVSRCLKKLQTVSWGYAEIVDTSASTEVIWLKNFELLNIPNMRAFQFEHVALANRFSAARDLRCIHNEAINPRLNKDYFIDLAPYENCNNLSASIIHTEQVANHLSRARRSHGWCIPFPRIHPCMQRVEVTHVNPNRNAGTLDCIKFPPNNIKFMNFSHCYQCYSRGIGPVLGLHSLRILDVSYSNIEMFSETFFRYIPSLRELYVQGNRLYMDGIGIFPPMSLLQFIDMSENSLQFLPPSVFRNTPALKYLSLANNGLHNLSFIENLTSSLNELDVSNNRISTLNKHDMSWLKRAKQSNFILNLHSNPFQCGCDDIPFLKWIQETPIHIPRVQNLSCFDDGRLEKLYFIDIASIERACLNLYLIMSLSLALPITAFIVSFVLYNKRWVLKWHYHKIKRRLHRGRANITNMDETFNAFVIYPYEDDGARHWAFRVLMPKLEAEWNLSLFLLGRDDIPGDFVINNIVDGLNRSRKAIWVLTPEFLKDNMCINAAHFALCHYGVRSNLITTFDNNRINLDDVPKNMTGLLNPKMKIKRMKFSIEDPNYRLFWDRLQCFLIEDQDDFDITSDVQRALVI